MNTTIALLALVLALWSIVRTHQARIASMRRDGALLDIVERQQDMLDELAEGETERAAEWRADWRTRLHEAAAMLDEIEPDIDP